MVSASLSFKRPWGVLDGSESSNGITTTAGQTRTPPTTDPKGFPAVPRSTSCYNQIPATSSLSSLSFHPLTTRQSPSLYAHTPAPHLPPPSGSSPDSQVDEVLQRLADYASLSIILPLRHYAKYLILWRLGFRCTLWCLFLVLSKPRPSLLWLPTRIQPAWWLNLLFSDPVDLHNSFSPLTSSSLWMFLRILFREIVVITWASMIFAILLLSRVVLIRYGPPPRPMFVVPPLQLSLWRVASSQSLMRLASFHTKPWTLVTGNLLFSIFSAAGTTVATRLVIPQPLTILHSLLLGSLCSYQYISGRHYVMSLLPLSDDVNIALHSRDPPLRSVRRRSCQFLFTSCVMLCATASISMLIERVFPSFGETIKAIVALPFVTQLPLLSFASPPSGSASSTWLFEPVLLLGVSVFLLWRLEEHNDQIQKLMDLNLLRSTDELLALFNDQSYVSQMIIALKLYQFSRNVPALPSAILIQPTQAKLLPSFSNMVSTMQMQYAAVDRRLPTSTTGSFTPPPPVHIYFGTSYGPHRLLSDAAVRRNIMDDDNNMSKGSQPRIRFMPLSSRIPTSDMSIGKAMIPRLEGEEQSIQGKASMFQKLVWMILRGGAIQMIQDRSLHLVSSVLVKCFSPTIYRTVVTVGTLGIVQDTARLLFCDPEPLYRIGQEAQFHEAGGGSSCQIVDCPCQKGLLVNRWIYEMLLNKRHRDTLWNLYVSRFLKVNEACVTSIALFQRLANCRSVLTDGRRSQSQFVLSLETLSAAQSVHACVLSVVAPRSLSAPLSADSVWGSVLVESCLTCAAARIESPLQASTTSFSAVPDRDVLARRNLAWKEPHSMWKESQRTPPPGVSCTIPPSSSSTGRLERVGSHKIIGEQVTSSSLGDGSSLIDEAAMRELTEDCYKCLRIVVELVYLYSHGFKQWLKIAKTLRVSMGVMPSVQRIVLSAVKCVEQINLFLDEFNKWKPPNALPHLITEPIYLHLKQKIVFNLMHIHQNYLDLLNTAQTDFLPTTSNLVSRIRNL